MRYGSVCSGIEAASVAWHPLGWSAAWLAEIEPFPSAVLAHHYPEVPNLGDMTRISRRVLTGEVEAPELLVGGTPCQAFSVAGLREGLADARGALTIKYVELADAIDFIRRRRGEPEAVIVWENVPGVLSSKDNAFGCFLGALAGEGCELEPPGGKWKDAGCVFGPARAVAWRVLDAQYFGVAQRRRRVFVVASARKGFDPAAVLFEFDGVRRDSAPSRGQGQNATVGTLRSTDGGSDVDHARAGHLQPVVGTLQANGKAAGSVTQQDAESGLLIPVQCVTGDIAHTLKAEGFDASEDGTGRGQPIIPVLSVHGTQDPDVNVNLAHTLGRNQWQENAVFGFQSSQSGVRLHVTHATLDANNGSRRHNGVLGDMSVRRLTPTECERLQGFPEITKSLRITVWHSLDHQKNFVNAAIQSRRSPSSVSNADANASQQNASAVASNFPIDPESRNGHAAVHVLIDLERQVLRLHSLGKLLWSASTAESQSSYLLRMPSDAFARLVAHTITTAEKTIPVGKAALRRSIKLFSHHQSGSVSAHLYGREIDELANDAGKFTQTLSLCTKFITSEAGRDSLNSEPILETLCCCVAAAISSSIPDSIRTASSFDIVVETVAGYTNINIRGKPAADGPRYKAIGNSKAVPVVQWLGRRIDDALRSRRRVAA